MITKMLSSSVFNQKFKYKHFFFLKFQMLLRIFICVFYGSKLKWKATARVSSCHKHIILKLVLNSLKLQSGKKLKVKMY